MNSAIHPYGAVLLSGFRRQLEEYITSELGPEYLAKARGKIELQKIKKEIAENRAGARRAFVQESRA